MIDISINKNRDLSHLIMRKKIKFNNKNKRYNKI